MEKGKYLALANKYKEVTGLDLDGELLFNTFEKLKNIKVNDLNEKKKVNTLSKEYQKAYDTIIEDIYNKFEPHYIAGENAPEKSGQFLQEFDHLMNYIFDNELEDKWKLKENNNLSYGELYDKNSIIQGNDHQYALFKERFNGVSDAVNDLKRSNLFTKQRMINELTYFANSPQADVDRMVLEVKIAREYLKSLNPIKRFFQFGLKSKIDTLKDAIKQKTGRSKSFVEKYLKDYKGDSQQCALFQESTYKNAYEKEKMTNYSKVAEQYDLKEAEKVKTENNGILINIEDNVIESSQNKTEQVYNNDEPQKEDVRQI